MEVRLRRIRTSHPHFATEGTERTPGDTETLLVYRHYIPDVLPNARTALSVKPMGRSVTKNN
jgi:hypothetical protein